MGISVAIQEEELQAQIEYMKKIRNYSVPSPRSTAGSPMTADLIAS